MTHERLFDLISRQGREELSPAEDQELKDFLERLEEHEIPDALVQDWVQANAHAGATPPAGYEKIVDNHLEHIFSFDKRLVGAPVVRSMRRWWVAASVMLMLAAGLYWWAAPQKERASVAAVIQPGKKGAILTLADGSPVSLDTVQNATIALQGGVTAKLVNGSLVYEGKGNETVYNTVSTPKGRQFHMILPDGTGVWLNAASTIRYPTAFTGAERMVEITGEAYFEVRKNERMPFRVNAGNRVRVEVLGTHFNINAYDNESIVQTTLIAGKVKVVLPLSDKSVILRPGQQAQSGIDGRMRLVEHANTEKAMAWKNGLFNFEDMPLKEVMRQLERWYDIEVVYQDDVPDYKLGGEMTRDVTLNDLIVGLEKLGVQAALEGRKLTILKPKSK